MAAEDTDTVDELAAAVRGGDRAALAARSRWWSPPGSTTASRLNSCCWR
ncbi:hypothetical protein I552_5810 [Mycobacterium xenopi 3993]|nr:hypothetical protein I552_5810 [Mycobacterium xenopi 3993]